jgi:hypothetical protein
MLNAAHNKYPLDIIVAVLSLLLCYFSHEKVSLSVCALTQIHALQCSRCSFGGKTATDPALQMI